jgi:hypothetical protein
LVEGKGMRRSRKNLILKTITWLAGIGMVMSAFALEALEWTALGVFCVCATWMGLVMAANTK